MFAWLFVGQIRVWRGGAGWGCGQEGGYVFAHVFPLVSNFFVFSMIGVHCCLLDFADGVWHPIEAGAWVSSYFYLAKQLPLRYWDLVGFDSGDVLLILSILASRCGLSRAIAGFLVPFLLGLQVILTRFYRLIN